MDYIDGITIIDTSGIILFSVKFNPRWNASVQNSIVGRKLLDVFTDLDQKTSTLFQCMEFGKPVSYQEQYLDNQYSRKAVIEGISYPIKINGLIMGAVEISKERSREEGPSSLTVDDSDIREILRKSSVAFSDKARFTLKDIICESMEMKGQVEYAKKIADSPSPVLIFGQTGTGKELFAHGIHEASGRRTAPFIVQNCSAIPESLLESILLGTCKGSFTGAVDRKGIFEIANGGTLFLDEIHAMPVHLQAKLLRVIQDGFVRRIGAEKERKIDVRIIAATNVDYETILSGGIIRKDLFYRLSVLNIHIPVLKERREDLEPLIQYFIRKYNIMFHKAVKGVSPQVLQVLKLQEWPGNVRELENLIEACINVIQPEKRWIEVIDLPKIYQKQFPVIAIRPMKETLETMEIQLIQEALSQYGGNISRAAKALRLPRQTLQQKMKKYGIGRLQPK